MSVWYRVMSEEPPQPTDAPPASAPLPEARVLPDLPAPQPIAATETLTRRFVGISLKRAFRLNIKVDEVLPTERAHLEATAAHIVHPEQQAFLAWRRSVLLLVALMFIPLSVFAVRRVVRRPADAADRPHLHPAARARPRPCSAS